MIRSKTLASALAAGLVALLAVPAAQADDMSSVESARMKERQGVYLDREEREQLRRYGSNDDYGYRGGYDTYDGPRVGVYIGPRPYYDPYDEY